MKKIINELINYGIEGANTYHHNGSIWLIFTETKKWVIELEKNGTLWYNYYFFNNLFNYLSLNVVENQHYITKWVEDVIQNGVKSTITLPISRIMEVEDVIQNGVKSTINQKDSLEMQVANTIQNGVRVTTPVRVMDFVKIENTIQNGVKVTVPSAGGHSQQPIEVIIQNGDLIKK